MLSILGLVIGFLARTGLLTDFFGMWKQSVDNKHERTMRQMEFDNSEKIAKIRLAEAHLEASVDNTKDARSHGGALTQHRIRWVDALRGCVAPILALTACFVWATIKIAAIFALGPATPLFVYLALITPFDEFVIGGTFGYFFGGKLQGGEVK